MKASQEARLEALRLSALPHTIIDTSNMEWDMHASKIASALRRSTEAADKHVQMRTTEAGR